MVDDSPFIVIFTDLDGTLLDHISYGWEDAKPALRLCKRLNIPVILVSSKTRAEMEIIRLKLELAYPFISENGGGIFFPGKEHKRASSSTFSAKKIREQSPGLPYCFLVRCFKEIREELGWNMRGFSEMTPEEISLLTGLGIEKSRLASEREYDEPFIVLEQEDVDTEVLYDAAKRRGLNISTGGRFYHLHGKNDKGSAVKKVISWYGECHSRVVTLALGDSPNDFSMLKQVNHPVLIRSSRHFPGVREIVPGLRITREPGPGGWNSAVVDIIHNEISIST